LKNYATSLKVEDSIPDYVIGVLKFTYSFQLQFGLGFDSSSNRNEYQESFWELRPAVRRVRLTMTAICEPTALENMEASMSHSPIGLHFLLQR
jgi:hypothetical protein